MYAVSAGDDLPEVMKWQDSYLSPKSFVLVLGESYTGPVTVNLAHIPHILLGGSTGSGKSVLLKLLLMQALQKGAMVWVADFKGGVDYPHTWGGLCEMVFTESDLLMTVDKLVHMLEQRMPNGKQSSKPNKKIRHNKGGSIGQDAPAFTTVILSKMRYVVQLLLFAF